MKRLFRSHNFQLVHHKKNLLDAAGIRCFVRNEFLSSAMGELPPAECQAELWVEREGDLDRARRVLFEVESGATAWRCPACGEASEPQFTQCWRCGAYRP